MIYEKCWCGSGEFKKHAGFRIKFFDRSSPKIEIVECKNCRTIRMYDNSLKAIPDYQSSYEYQKLSGRHSRTIQTIAQNYFGTSVLDVGCNTGILLSGVKNELPQIGKLKGIDLDEKAIITGKEKYGLDLEAKDLAELDGKYDNIILCHTLEHILELEETFQKLDELLNPNGRLFFSVPNIKSFNARTALRLWKSLSPKYHLWYFDINSMTKCFNKFLPEYKVIHSSSYFTWAPLYYSEPVWKIMRKQTPGLVEKLENNFWGDQLDVALQKPGN
ncbi:MAG: class I SAM-dependent methyltransferase [Draconibacterium sp.]